MKKSAISLCLASLIALPALADARPVTLTTQLKNYGGNGAYMAIYLTDAKGQYQKTLWVSGKKTKYFKHLRDWARGSGLSPSEYDGMSGASVSSGRSMKVMGRVATPESAAAWATAGAILRIRRESKGVGMR